MDTKRKRAVSRFLLVHCLTTIPTESLTIVRHRAYVWQPGTHNPQASASPAFRWCHADRLACSVYQIHFHLHTKLGPLPLVSTRGVTSCKLRPWWGARIGAVVVNAEYVKLFETTRICNSFDFWLCFPQTTLPLIYFHTLELFKYSCTMKLLFLLIRT
jgi:hypothetical protein